MKRIRIEVEWETHKPEYTWDAGGLLSRLSE